MFRNYYFNLLSATLLFCWVTLYSGFPIIYTDSATYIKAGFLMETPVDRPITYSLFILLTSGYKLSVFLIVFFQNLLLAYLLLESYLRCLGRIKLNLFLIVVLVLSACTGLSWVSNQLFADLFTPFIFLSAFLILTAENFSKRKFVFLYFIFLFSVATHLSHISITELFLFGFVPLAAWILPRSTTLSRKVIFIRGTALIIVGFAAILSMGSAIAKSSPIFFTGKLCENGILKKYLDENCGSKNYKLCPLKSELTCSAIDFIWSPDGATNKLGGWDEVLKEYSEIDSKIVHSPEYLKLLALESVKSSYDQCFLNNIGEGNSHLLKNSNVTGTLNRYFPREYNLFIHSRQSSEEINYAGFNFIYNLFYGLSFLGFIFLFIRKIILKQFDLMFLFGVLIILGISSNHICGASLANAVNRFGVRVIWLMTFSSLLMIIESVSSGRPRQRN
jgi:hypothetical protein